MLSAISQVLHALSKCVNGSPLSFSLTQRFPLLLLLTQRHLLEHPPTATVRSPSLFITCQGRVHCVVTPTRGSQPRPLSQMLAVTDLAAADSLEHAGSARRLLNRRPPDASPKETSSGPAGRNSTRRRLDTGRLKHVEPLQRRSGVTERNDLSRLSPAALV